ncbi:hypothetical protein MPTK1_4g02910 [Marchantia polymorpha subsp. ruderalis]|uniref:Acyltransferase 3 domain-containing protein n=2 Tax=Marchantia polymorpha TaxID=3197 RepID=A0AAF6B5P1_MARPO|nr:hypothetical protein MARPO_0080s0008 [Marchantia polymorpha]BBN07325.1 hypothetical protein Mp_4g02910 [Marchantia polymorpha subsp. ruderalis]|eukprot:PTQ34379.1 hypothetical protein MARPO_0080s0008 [Marchantia polymorpha]
MGGRANDVDWLRTVASYLVVVYHAAQIFDFQNKSYYKNAERSPSLDLFTRFVHLWHMPLFFLLAGWSCKLSLERRGAAKFLIERAQKLLVPLLFGMLVLCAAPRWVEYRCGRWKPRSEEGSPSPLVHSFTTFLRVHYYFEGLTWNHLWFLVYLFTFCAIYLPGFWLLSHQVSGRPRGHPKWTWVMANGPVVLLAVVQLRLRNRWPGYQNLVDDWANFWFYSIFFIAGFCLSLSKSLEDHIHLHWKMNGALGLLSCCLYVFPDSFSRLYFSNSEHIQHVLSSSGAWYFVCFLRSAAHRYLSNHPAPAFLSDNAFPVYIIHEVPLFLFAHFVLGKWSAPVGIKFAASVTVALLSSLLVLQTIVNRSRVFSFLLGAKEVKRVKSGPHQD